MKNPKTTILGILMIASAVIHAAICYLNNQPVDTTVLFAAITGGIGLIAAKDSSTHSTPQQVGQAGAKAEEKKIAA